MSTENNTQYFDISLNDDVEEITLDDDVEEDRGAESTCWLSRVNFMKIVRSTFPCVERLSDVREREDHCFFFASAADPMDRRHEP